MALDHIDQQAARIAELDDAVSGPLENIAKMLETVNEDMIFSGIIQTWKNENLTLKSQITDMEKRNADLEARIGHEQVVTMQDREAQLQRYIRELEAQVTTLKEIAEDERAYILSVNVMESTGVDEFIRTEARRQLVEEHPEVDWK
jgi:predicted  nucleic acid-binding Zn-ribbon protein